MELLDKQVTLFVGREIKAHFPHIESVVVDVPLQSPAPALEPLSVVAELAAFDPRPTISIDAIHITVSGDVTLCGVCRLGESPCS